MSIYCRQLILYQLFDYCKLKMVGVVGFEPTIYGSQNRRISQTLLYSDKMEPTIGLEPTTCCLQNSRTTSCAISANKLVETVRIELTSAECKSAVLTIELCPHKNKTHFNFSI